MPRATRRRRSRSKRRGTGCTCFVEPVGTARLLEALAAGADVAEKLGVEGSWAVANAAGTTIGQLSTANSQPENHYAAAGKAATSAWMAVPTRLISDKLGREGGPLYHGYQVQGRPLMSTPGGIVACDHKCGYTPLDRLGIGASVNTTHGTKVLKYDMQIAEAVKAALVAE